MDKKTQINISEWVNPSNLEQFQIKNQTITSKDDTLVILGKKKIGEKYNFKVNFSKTSGVVALGIINPQNRDNKFLYWSNKFYNTGHEYGPKGNGFIVGEKIEVIVDLKQGSIVWRVGNEIRHQVLDHEWLKDKTISWVPQIFFARKDDSVEIIEQEGVNITVPISEWIDKIKSTYDKLLFNGRSIAATKEGDTRIFGKNKIEGQYTFSATFARAEDVALGIISFQKQQYKYVYWNNSQWDFAGVGGCKGPGYKAGEKIKVTVNLNEGSIKWQVKGVIIYKTQNQEFIKDKSIRWVPQIIFLKSKDQSVEILQE